MTRGSLYARGRRRSDRVSRDPRSEDEFAAILDYAERAHRGDEDARAVLHDTLLSRYPRVYGNLIRLAESPLGKGRVVDRGCVLVEGRSYCGPRLIILYPRALAAAEAGVREPRQPARLPSGWTVARLFDHRLSRAFDVIVASGYQFIDVNGNLRPSPYPDRVVTYVSRRTEGLIVRSIRRMERGERAAKRRKLKVSLSPPRRAT